VERLQGKFSGRSLRLIDAPSVVRDVFSQANSTADAKRRHPGFGLRPHTGNSAHHLNASASYDLTDRTTVGAGGRGAGSCARQRQQPSIRPTE